MANQMSYTEFSSLEQWLQYCEQLHPQEIQLGLERSQKVQQVLGLSFRCPVFVVAGTNGKGSTCAMLESILCSAGYKTGVYSSPHLVHFGERCRINQQACDAVELLPHFAAVEKARNAAGGEALTYFEFTTLAILHYMSEQNLGVAILEIGLGGRYDAVNIIDSDCAIVTNVDIDHVAFLGSDREGIGFEKAGIMRAGKPAIVNEECPPQSVLKCALEVQAQLMLRGEDYHFADCDDSWQWQGETPDGQSVFYNHLPYPALAGINQLGNAAGVLAALTAMQGQLCVSEAHIHQGLQNVVLPGRFQILRSDPHVILDVGHNPHAARALVKNLQSIPTQGRTLAVFGAMHDKDIQSVLDIMLLVIDEWFLTDLPIPRAIVAKKLGELLQGCALESGEQASYALFQTPMQALDAALKAAQPVDAIIVFGSFFTVGGVMESVALLR